MENVEYLRLPTAEEALLNRRASATERCFDLLKNGGLSLDLLPGALLNAFEVEAWKERPTPNKAMVACDSFIEWVTAPFPRGLGSTLDVIEAILTSAKNKADAMRAKVLFDQAVQGSHGGDRRSEAATKIDNVNLETTPSGNSEAAGLRRLRKAADNDDDKAKEIFAEVLSGDKSVHAACVEMGWRPKTVTVRDEPDAFAKHAKRRWGALSTIRRLLPDLTSEERDEVRRWLDDIESPLGSSDFC